MGQLRERIDAYAHVSANLIDQLNELDDLREQVRQAQLSHAMPKRTKDPASTSCVSRHLSGDERCPGIGGPLPTNVGRVAADRSGSGLGVTKTVR
jgi:hypothetical protein